MRKRSGYELFKPQRPAQSGRRAAQLARAKWDERQRVLAEGRLGAVEDLQDRDWQAATHGERCKGLGRETEAEPGEVDLLIQTLSRARIQYETFRSQYGTAGGAAANQMTVAARERAMTRKSAFHVSMIPGLLQTAKYAQEMLMRPSGPPMHGATEDDVTRMVAIRMQRQQYVLYGSDNKYFDVVLLEGALRTRVCSIDTMIEQLDRLVGLNGLARITFGVIPFGAEVPTIPLTGFDVFDGDEVFIETVTSELRVTRVEEVRNYMRLFEMLQKAAVYGSDVVRLIRDAMNFYDNLKNNA